MVEKESAEKSDKYSREQIRGAVDLANELYSRGRYVSYELTITLDPDAILDDPDKSQQLLIATEKTIEDEHPGLDSVYKFLDTLLGKNNDSRHTNDILRCKTANDRILYTKFEQVIREQEPNTNILISKRVTELFSALSDRQKEILYAYYGIKGDRRNAKQLEGELGISDSRVLQIKNRALGKISGRVTTPLKEFFDKNSTK